MLPLDIFTAAFFLAFAACMAYGTYQHDKRVAQERRDSADG